MKNLFFFRLWALLIALCSTIGLSAQYLTELSEITSGDYYRIVNAERGQAMTAFSGSSNIGQEAINRSSRYQRWQITYDETSKMYQLYNDGCKMFIAKPSSVSEGTQMTVGSEAGNFIIRKTTVNQSQSTYFNILPEGSSNQAFNNYGGNSGAGMVRLYAANAGGEWKIEPFTDADLQEGEMFDRGILRLKSRRTSTKYATEQSSHLLNGATKIDTSTGNYSQIWLLSPNGNGGYMIYNMGSGRPLTHADKNVQYKTADNGGDTFYFMRSANSTSTQTYWNIAHAASYSSEGDQRGLNYNDQLGKVLCWTFDEGSDWIVESVPDDEITLDQARDAVFAAQDHPAITDGGYYYISNYMYGSVMQEDFNSRTIGLMKTGGKIEGNYAQIWKAVKQSDGTYAIQNVASKRYIQPSTWNQQYTTSTSEYGFYVDENAQYRYERAYNFKQSANASASMHQNSEGVVLQWTASNSGPNNKASEWLLSKVELTEVQLAEAEAQYARFMDIQLNGSAYGMFFGEYFNDYACTDMKAEYKAMTDEELLAKVDTQLNDDLKAILIKLKNNKWQEYASGNDWEQMFRVRTYGAYSDKEAMGNALKLNPWSRINNPTGITSGTTGTPVYVFVDDFTMPSGGKLYAEFLSGVNLGGKAFNLQKGLNIIFNDEPDAQLFIFYETNKGDLIANYSPIKIHIEGGDVNGFFDTTTQSDDEWVAMWNDGLFGKAFAIDVMGKYAMWHMNKEKVHAAIGDQPNRMMKIWDRIVELEINLMGIQESEHYKNAAENLYPSVYNNHMAGVSATKNYMWSQNGGTFYEEGTLASVLNFDGMNGTGALWGPAHEIGHNNQTAIKLVGTTEVSNNLFSNMVVHEFGRTTTRYWAIQDRQNKMDLSWPEFYNSGGEPIAPMNRMYFTLYLYYHVLNNQPDFYQKVFESLRHDGLKPVYSTTNPTYASNDYLKFAKVVCDVAQQDLTEFFDFWGFFKPCDEQIGDYSNYRLVNDEAQIAEWKEYIAGKNYPKNGNILFLDDRAEKSFKADGTEKDFMGDYSYDKCQNHMGSFSAFRANAVPEAYSATVSAAGRVSITAGTGAVGYKIYDAEGNLVYVATQNSFTLPSWVTDKQGIAIVAAAADPANDLLIYGELSGIESIDEDASVVKGDNVIYDLLGRPVKNPEHGIYIVNGKKVVL